MKARQSRRLRQATLVLGGCLALYCLLFVSSSTIDDEAPGSGSTRSTPRPASSKLLTPELLANLSLSEEQCNAAFPGLTKEIDDAVAEGPFKVKSTGDRGHLQGRIEDGQLSIINTQRKVDLSREMANSRSAALHQLHRALITSPSPLPDTIFSLNFQDQPFGTAWTYSRPADPTFRSNDPDVRNFLMPHFSFWAWPLPFIGSMDRAARAIAAIESGLPFARKIPKAVWRGTTWFNSVQNPRMRQNLIVASRGRPWADIEALEWTTAATGRAGAAGAAGGGNSRNASNALPIEDFCRYKYVVHTEGIAYSGRFQFLQMCASVVITPPILWMQHTTHLVRPVFSSDLAGTGGGASADSRAKAAGAPGTGAGAGWVESERIRNSWPVRYRPEEANIVFVAPDWSDLEATVTWLEDHPDVAEGIARRQREMFVGGGYFSPAAEACYWRALVRGWAEVARTEGMGWEDLEGVTFEAFSLTGGD